MPTESIFADTSVIYYRMHGTREQLQKYRELIGANKLFVNNYIKGEYIRGFVATIVDLYYLVKAENDVEEGTKVFINEYSFKSRKIKSAMIALLSMLVTKGSNVEVALFLNKLGEYIRGRLIAFDSDFINKTTDPVMCEYGRMYIPHEEYSEELIDQFSTELEMIRESPTCDQCKFKGEQLQKLQVRQINLCDDAHKQTYKKHEGFLKQADYLKKVLDPQIEVKPACIHCDKLGDTIIALSVPNEMSILTGDMNSFPALGGILGRKIIEFPSFAKIRKANQQ